MGAIWPGMVVMSILFAVLSGNMDAAAGALMDSGSKAISLTIVLLASMALWSGIMEILRAAGDISRIGKVFRRAAAPMFKGLTDQECWDALSLNMAANLFGLGNAATPAGIRASLLLAKQGAVGERCLAMMLAVNNAGFQIIPSTVIMLRRAAGSAAPADIWLPTLASSGTALIVATALLQLLQRGEKCGR